MVQHVMEKEAKERIMRAVEKTWKLTCMHDLAQHDRCGGDLMGDSSTPLVQNACFRSAGSSVTCNSLDRLAFPSVQRDLSSSSQHSFSIICFVKASP